MPLPMTDAVLFVHGTGANANNSLNNNNGVWGDPLCSNGSSNNQYSNLELDLGSGAGGGPVGFPSYTEKGMGGNSTNVQLPASVVGPGGAQFGLHIVLGQAYNNSCGNLTITALSSSTNNVTPSGNNNVASRTIPYADLITGTHFFIPINTWAVKEFNRFLASTSDANNNATSGTVMAWYGPPTGGEM